MAFHVILIKDLEMRVCHYLEGYKKEVFTAFKNIF